MVVSNLLGVSITKEFIPSIANTVGTDMSKYKIVQKGRFAYGPVTSRNGDKISVALLEDDSAIVSTSYTVFEIIDKNELLPQYLMMWFRREEFDRYARYMSHGSTREVFGWDEMCDVELPIPSIEKQREIVAEYYAITNRIKLNEQLNKKLEETAQAIYKEWFVDFNFLDENGKPYKSNGGEMVWCEELEKEIPKGWGVDSFSSLISICSGKPLLEKKAIRTNDFKYPVYGAGGIMGYSKEYLFNSKLLSIGRVGTHGVVQRLSHSCWLSDNTLVIESLRYEYVYQILLSINYGEINRGGVQGLITQTDIKNIPILVAPNMILDKFENKLSNLFFFKIICF